MIERVVYLITQRWVVGFMLLGFCMTVWFQTPSAQAVSVMVQTKTAAANSTTASATFTTTPVSGRLLIAVCASRANTTFSTPTNFSVAKNEAGTPSQGIFYKVSNGTESTITCTGTVSGRMGIHIYEYAGVLSTTPFERANTTASTGTGTAQSSASLTTTSSPDLLFAALVTNSNSTYNSWSNSFVERNDFKSNTQAHFGAADRQVTANGAYSTTGTNSLSSAWRGQIAAFNLMPIQLVADIVDGSGASVASPSVTFPSQTFGFSCQTATTTLGSATQKIRVTNTTATAGWQISIAPTNGATAVWSDGGTNTYDMNDPTSTGCTDGPDADSVGGQMTINPSVSTVTPSMNGCTLTGITKGASTAFNQGVTNSIPLLTSAGGNINCSWDITDISISQQIPAEQHYTSYSLGLTMTIVAQ